MLRTSPETLRLLLDSVDLRSPDKCQEQSQGSCLRGSGKVGAGTQPLQQDAAVGSWGLCPVPCGSSSR